MPFCMFPSKSNHRSFEVRKRVQIVTGKKISLLNHLQRNNSNHNYFLNVTADALHEVCEYFPRTAAHELV